MNCKNAQENLHEYQDGALSAPEMGSLRRHLEECAACRQMVQREMEFARLTSCGLERAVNEVRLEPHARRRIAQVAVQKNLARCARHDVPSFWVRLGWQFAAAGAVVLVLGIGALQRFGSHPHSQPDPAHVSMPSGRTQILVNLNYFAPSYTFRWEGDTVVDCLVYEPRVAEASLTVKN
jgi:anti-sigma factor RsiW